MAQVTQVFVSYGRTSSGYTLDVTYRCAGEPHVWRYLELRQLLHAELVELLELLPDVLMPGREAPGTPGQLPLGV